ncbi:Putative protein [Zobellia galactanivorans]|uniref:Peptidase A2 domain-containing protein n=1 Tax=Zobellia galactanivorans (strain DSM 12802 / CCUG 47099 / CIP 106680 / NCIMB 13871 / Dsij) TaxID=63186 RepID=G0L0Q5_ZOBGA|nr:Putative protein [Zobellia galactanivorans]
MLIFFHVLGYTQRRITRKKINGIYMIPCKENGLALKFVLDTGASDVSISERGLYLC